MYNKNLALLIVTVLYISLVVSCDKEVTDPEWPIGSDKIIFIEHHISTHGELIDGVAPPLLMVDFPTYSFNQTTGKLDGTLNFDVNKKLKIIYGNGSSLSGTLGRGTASSLSGIIEMPFKESDIMTFSSVEPDGTIHFTYKDSIFVMNPGEKWLKQTSEIYNQSWVDGYCKMKLSENEYFINHGIVEKTNIQKR